MKKIRLMMAVFAGVLCMTGCGNIEVILPSATGSEQEEATKTTEETKVQEDTEVVKEDETNEDVAEMMNPAVLTGGGLPFTKYQ